MTIFANLANLQWQQVVMWAIGALLIYLAIKKEMEPALLLPLQIRQIRKNRHTVSSQQGFHGFAHWTQRFRNGSQIFTHLNRL